MIGQIKKQNNCHVLEHKNTLAQLADHSILSEANTNLFRKFVVQRLIEERVSEERSYRNSLAQERSLLYFRAGGRKSHQEQSVRYTWVVVSKPRHARL